jgi:quercetin dioxygenase-like cupin family protein
MRKLLAYFREDPVPVIHADQAAVHTMHGTSFTAYASPGRGSRELCAWHFQIPAHTTGVRHHVSREEVLYVLSGTIQASVDGRAEQATAGDMILVPVTICMVIGCALGTPGMSDGAGSWC